MVQDQVVFIRMKQIQVFSMKMLHVNSTKHQQSYCHHPPPQKRHSSRSSSGKSTVY